MRKDNDIFGEVKNLAKAIHLRQGELSPHSNGRGHGRLLRLIANHDGILGKELALHMNISASTLSEKLNGLEEDGNIARVRDARDRRQVHIHLTPDGWTALRRREHGAKRQKELIASVMTEEEQALFCTQCRMLTEALMQKTPEEEAENVLSFYDETQGRELEGQKEHLGS
ncbi:MAG: MarR family transcriptional regulator [Oscillospiraceae bacterium]|nr:MarR family transcriptional regulator [Oscillospiraceae bacterium]